LRPRCGRRRAVARALVRRLDIAHVISLRREYAPANVACGYATLVCAPRPELHVAGDHGPVDSRPSELIERYVKFIRSVPLPLLIAIVWLKGFAFGWLVARRR
jgi:hypothetical protein